MPRSNFFSNVSPIAPKNDEAAQRPDTIGDTSPLSEVSVVTQKSKRTAYTIKMDPDIRKKIKDWALANDVTISSVIESLARLHLGDLKKEDIVP